VLDDPAFAPLRARVRVVVNPLLEAQAPNGRGAVVTITTRDGRKVSERVDHPRGHSARGGVTWDELAVKWRDAAPEQDVDSWIVAARKLEDLEHVGRLSGLFTRQP
jgi:2-methylcitrate dehydratase PrpD